jgi:hypothetical protein
MVYGMFHGDVYGNELSIDEIQNSADVKQNSSLCGETLW